MIIYSKEYIANTKVMRRDVHDDGSVKIEYVREAEFKDTKKYPNLKLNIPVVETPKIEKEVIEAPVKPEPLEDVKKIVETLGDMEKTEEKQKKRQRKKEE